MNRVLAAVALLCIIVFINCRTPLPSQAYGVYTGMGLISAPTFTTSSGALEVNCREGCAAPTIGMGQITVDAEKIEVQLMANNTVTGCETPNMVISGPMYDVVGAAQVKANVTVTLGTTVYPIGEKCVYFAALEGQMVFQFFGEECPSASTPVGCTPVSADNSTATSFVMSGQIIGRVAVSSTSFAPSLPKISAAALVMMLLALLF